MDPRESRVHTCTHLQEMERNNVLVTSRVVKIGKALAHPARVRILVMLKEGELCGCEFTPSLCLDPSVVSRHLSTLAQAGLIESRRDGARVMWNLCDSTVIGQLECLVALTEEREAVR
jgi:DNA-binding transcriptional ArsR family regulator